MKTPHRLLPVTRRGALRLVAFSLLAFAAALLPRVASAADAPKKLNLLYITADDMNFDSPGWMGCKLGETPTLDALAGTCHRFVNNHVTAPICQPSREAMMTGRVPHRSGGLGFNPINPGTPTLTAVLKAQGYYTAAMNKHQHMKPDAEFPWDDKYDGSGKNPSLMRMQMDEALKKAADLKKPFFINANITDPHRPFPGGTAAPGDNEDGPADAQPKKKAGAGKAKPPAGGDTLEAPAAKANKKAAKKGKAGGQVNSPPPRTFTADEITVPDYLENIPPVRTEVAQYYTAVGRLDVNLKGILAALKEAGHEDDTLVLFMSDHGMSFPFSKATVYYNGTHSPVIFKWPGMPPTATHSEFVSSVDIMPTLLDILGAPKPDGMDGRSWLSILNGEKQTDRDYVITNVNTVSSGISLPQRCIRNNDFALMFHAWSNGTPHFKVEAMSGITYKALEAAGKTDPKIGERVAQYRVGTPLAFYNEQTDPAERANVVKDEKYKEEIQRMATKLREAMERTKDPQLENYVKALKTAGLKAD